MKGIIIINAYANYESILYPPKRLAEEFEKAGVEIEIIKNDRFICGIKDGKAFCRIKCDFCVYFDKEKHTLALLEKCGIKVFDCYKGITLCDDKAATLVALSDSGIKIPDFFPSPLCYTENAELNDENIRYLGRTLGYPVVVKENYGSQGKQVYLAEDEKELLSIAEKLRYKPHIYQKFISESYGKDLRVIVIGGKAIGAMKRTSESDFRSNVGSGGKGEVFPLDEETKKLCGKIAEILSLDYCGIDLLFGKDGYYVCEVNSNAFFGEFERVTGINVAKQYAEYIIKRISRE